MTVPSGALYNVSSSFSYGQYSPEASVSRVQVSEPCQDRLGDTSMPSPVRPYSIGYVIVVKARATHVIMSSLIITQIGRALSILKRQG